MQREARVWVVLGMFSASHWVWWQHTQRSSSLKHFQWQMSFILQQTLLGGQGGLAGGSAPWPVQPWCPRCLGRSWLWAPSPCPWCVAEAAACACRPGVLLLFALLPSPWPLPTPTPTPLCLYSLSFHSLKAGWGSCLLKESARQFYGASSVFSPHLERCFSWNRKNAEPWPGAASTHARCCCGGIPLGWAGDGRNSISLWPSA